MVNFYVLHYLLALLPLYYEWTETYKFKKSFYANVLGWCVLIRGKMYSLPAPPTPLSIARALSYAISESDVNMKIRKSEGLESNHVSDANVTTLNENKGM